IARLLEKRADRRPASAAAALVLIAKVRAGEPLDEAQAKVARLVGWLLAALVIIALALALFFATTSKAVGIKYARRDEAERTVAAAPPPRPTLAAAEEESDKKALSKDTVVHFANTSPPA